MADEFAAVLQKAHCRQPTFWYAHSCVGELYPPFRSCLLQNKGVPVVLGAQRRRRIYTMALSDAKQRIDAAHAEWYVPPRAMTGGNTKPTGLLDTLERLKRDRQELNGLIEDAAIIFVDLAGSTDYKDKKGIALGVGKAVTFNLDIRAIVGSASRRARRAGSIEKCEICKFLGDGVLVYVTGERASSTALGIAIDIQEHFAKLNEDVLEEVEKSKARIVVDYGEVLFAEYSKKFPRDPHGLTVDRASRVLGLTKPGQILITEYSIKAAGDHLPAKTSGAQTRRFRGINESVRVRELLWVDKKMGIDLESKPQVSLVAADEPSVFRFIEENNLFDLSKEIELCLYTYETLASASRHKLEGIKRSLSFRVLIRNPKSDANKAPFIEGSVRTMAEVMRKNPRVSFSVRFYDQEPMLRTYLFHRRDRRVEGLLGIYRHDPSQDMEFVGAEDNQLLHTRGDSQFEKTLLSLHKSRFDHEWQRLAIDRAVIFDLDGVLIDSMPFYWHAWREAFKLEHIEITKDDVYEREGLKKQDTVKELYEKYLDDAPSERTATRIIRKKESIYRDCFSVKFVPGMVELAETLRRKGVKLGLVTGATSLKEKFRGHEDVLKMFDVIIDGDDTSNGKPSPDPYIRALGKLECEASQACVIENAPLGIRAAKAAKLFCFAFKQNSPLSGKTLKGAGADVICQDVSELRSLVTWIDANVELGEFLRMFGLTKTGR